jgi:predicted permease
MDALIRNVRYALRGLARTPAFTLTVILTLALGVGANTAVFSAIDGVLLKALPYSSPDRLVRLNEAREGYDGVNVAPVRIEDWRRLNATFEAIHGYLTSDVADLTGALPERVHVASVTEDFLKVWGVAPALGRGFSAEEHLAGGPGAVIVSDRYWRTRLGADPGVLGRPLRTAEGTYSIVGVMPASFIFPDRGVDIWAPVARDDWFLADRIENRSLLWLQAIGRLGPGVTLDQARADIARVQVELAERYPETDGTVRVRIESLADVLLGNTSASLWLLFGAVTVLLLIACTNIAALLLARAAQRAQEIAVRFSLGASRASVSAQLLVEAGVLAVVGALAGLAVATGGIAAIRTLVPDLLRVENVTVDGRVLVYTLVAAIVVAVLCGVIPALRGTRESSSAARAGRALVSARQPLPWLLVGVQIALSVTLLAGAGLLLRSLDALTRVDPGFDPTGVLAFRVTGDFAETGDFAAWMQSMYGRIDALAEVPGIEATAISATELPGVPGLERGFQVAAREFDLVEGDEGLAPMFAEERVVTPGYFATLGVPVLAGDLCRRPNPAPREADHQNEVMVNRAFADRYLTGRNAIGLHFAGGDTPNRIVGIVGNAREVGIDSESSPIVYDCGLAGNPFSWFFVRYTGETAAVADLVRAKIAEVEPQRSVYDMAPLDESIGAAFAQNRLRTLLLTLFAATALALACLGVYGTLSYAVSLRRREVGLRVALGARRRDIVAQFVSRALRIVGAAVAIGIVVSFAVTRLLSGMLFGVTPWDPVTFAGVIAVVAAAALLASWLPARRASRINPMQTLREE